MSEKETPFFVGYLPVPHRLRPLLIAVAVVLSVLFALVGWGWAVGQNDPGAGAFRFDYGEQTVSGVLQVKPYPILYVSSGSERIAAGRTIMLAGQGKRGVLDSAAPLDGKFVQAKGIILKRGDLDMLQLQGGAKGLSGVDGDGTAPGATPLGRWKLAGEICDGKCLAGAMRPGTGLAHKACANLCLAGGVPPIFVSSQPVEGSQYLLLADADGEPLPDWLYDRTAIFLSIEGDLERRGDLLIFRVDPASIEVL